MVSKTWKIIIVLLAVFLAIVCAFTALDGWNSYKSSKSIEEYYRHNSGVEEIQTHLDIDTLTVTYWNPWGGFTGHSIEMIDYPAFTLADYVTDSAIIVSATVTESIPWDDTTDEGVEKLKELDSDWISSFGRESYLDVNEIFKGNFKINHIYLKTDMKTPEFKVGDTYLLFISGSSTGNSDYWIRVTEGYLIKNESNFEGMGNVSISEDDLRYLMSFSDDELALYQQINFASQVFIGEMLTSTNDADLVHYGGLEAYQNHKVRVIAPIKGNLSGTVEFVYDGTYITKEMMQAYLTEENMSPDVAERYVKTWFGSNETGYYNENYWDPKVSPLKAGDIYLICLIESEGRYSMWASKTDYKIEEQNKRELQKLAKEYQETLEKISVYLSYNY
ncbi:hypothetical protein MmiHf6_13360 [Methanimicrococcus hongohii]|uniref:Uncharacterized protein n=1 Tax=Methanimicrococcus hongohii TaxID=3028295 RepID=A0AA96V0B5_9EURY|nr:hypothetical protein [Methanimicrococcus sp. Hf6]WNY24011.1 hypothetical protein MmiHf6_13360 [Methanimicrococcus sp. Hf6]